MRSRTKADWTICAARPGFKVGDRITLMGKVYRVVEYTPMAMFLRLDRIRFWVYYDAPDRIRQLRFRLAVALTNLAEKVRP